MDSHAFLLPTVKLHICSSGYMFQTGNQFAAIFAEFCMLCAAVILLYTGGMLKGSLTLMHTQLLEFLI